MALIKLGTLAADIRGSQGGTVFARNRAGAYTRNRTKPVNPGTDSQSQVRAQFATLSNGFATSDRETVDAWNYAASLMTRLNRLGEPYVPTGRQIYMETNGNLLQCGLGINLLPPFDMSTPEAPKDFTIAAVSDTGVLQSLSITGLEAVNNYMIYATPPFLASKTNMSQHYRFIEYNAAPASPEAIFASYSARFGTNVDSGAVISFRLHVIDTNNGVRSPYVQSIVTVTEAP